MYYILVNDENELYASHKERIVQREKLFNKLCFLVPQYYKGFDMSESTVTMRYLRPISREFVTETLILSNKKYEEYLKYELPIDTDLSKEYGEIELNLTFTLLDSDDNGNVIQRVRKTTNCFVKVYPIPDWDAVVPDSALSALDERIIKQDAQIKALRELSATLNDSKADNIKYVENENSLQLLSGNKEIGDKVVIKDQILEDGVPVVNFGTSSGGSNSDSSYYDVVEF